MAYRPLMSEDRLVGAPGCRSSRAFQGAAGRRSSGSSESATSRGEEASAVEGSCAQLWRYTAISIHLKKCAFRLHARPSRGPWSKEHRAYFLPGHASKCNKKYEDTMDDGHNSA